MNNADTAPLEEAPGGNENSHLGCIKRLSWQQRAQSQNLRQEGKGLRAWD